MPWGLKRYQQARDLHFLTFSCYRREPLLASGSARDLVERALERARLGYRFYVTGYVVMPEHVHLLISEPERGTVARALQAMKQSVARRLIGDRQHFWQARYYDFNVWTEKKRIEKLRYIHRNPVTRGLVERPEDWRWSSFRHYLTGEAGVVEIESEWTARRRERMGLRCTFAETTDPPKQNRLGWGTRRGWFGATQDLRPGLSYVAPPGLGFGWRAWCTHHDV
jgi:putative transposase